MIMAGLNYTNLMIAKSLKRAREIGVRKVMGANRWQVFIQFVGESVVFSILALLVSYLILQFLKFSFLQFRLTQSFSVDLKESGVIYILFFLFACRSWNNCWTIACYLSLWFQTSAGFKK
jgi:ABC-type antimicrobial peptide transport system permease subunit